MKRKKITMIALASVLSLGVIGGIIGLSQSDFTLVIANPSYSEIHATINGTTLTTDANDSNFKEFNISRTGGTGFNKAFVYKLNDSKTDYAPINIQNLSFIANRKVNSVTNAQLTMNYIDQTSEAFTCQSIKEQGNGNFTYSYAINSTNGKKVEGFSIKLNGAFGPSISEVTFSYQCF